MRFLRSMLYLATLICSGCATITSSESQPVMVTALRGDGAPAEKAECKLANDKGIWSIVAPGVASVRRSDEDLLVECSKPGEPDGKVKAVSRAHGGMFGNILFGGVVGAVIDHNKGTGYEYPERIEVVMGRSLVLDRRDQVATAGSTQAPSIPATPVTGSALLEHFRTLQKVKTSAPPQMYSMTFRADGIVVAEFVNGLREGTHQLPPGRDQLCMKFNVFPGAKTLPYLNDCFTVHQVSGSRFLLRATSSAFEVLYDR